MVYLTFDTETMGTEEKLIYDLGFAIHDENGVISHTDRFLIKEVFDNEEIMAEAFYNKNIPFYLDLLAKGLTRKVSFAEAIKILAEVAETYCVDTICAYNLLFDVHSLYDTLKFAFFGTRKPRDENGKIIRTNNNLNPDSINFFSFLKNFVNRDILKREVNYLCLYGMTCVKLLTQDDYIHLAVKNQWLTDKGNIKTGAEFAYRYITQNPEFIETHTALEDVMIEVELFKQCNKIPGEYNEEIIYTPFRLVKKRYEAIYGKIA